MNLDSLLRDYARQDLQRFCPSAHYWMRDHDPIADRELVAPLLGEPVRFGLTPRERVAATALDALSTYALRSRAIWDAVSPVRDIGDTTPAPEMTFDEEREIWARREVFRSAALVYARTLGDVQLIEAYQTPAPAPEPKPGGPLPVVNRGTPKALTDAQEAEVVRLYDRSRGVSVNKLAQQFGVSNPTINKTLKNAGVKH